MLDIIDQMIDDEYSPDYVVGLTRGGLIPATMISHYFHVPLETLKVSFRDDGTLETNEWLPELATGYPKGHNLKNILIVDDINDTGKTFSWIKQDWQKSVKVVLNTWHTNVRFAVLVNNETSTAAVDFFAISINKAVEDTWVNFPWETWWK